MTSLFVSVIAIVLLAVVAVAGLYFLDVDETQSAAEAPAVASTLSTLVESAEMFKRSRGNYPLTTEDLINEFTRKDGDGNTSYSLNASSVNGKFAISDNIACLGLVYTVQNERTLQAAKLRVAGSVVSDTCGSIPFDGMRYISVSLDGVNVPSASEFVQSNIVAPDAPPGQPTDPFASATACNGVNSMPVNSAEERAAFFSMAGSCVAQRTVLAKRAVSSLDDIGNPPIDFSKVGGSDPRFVRDTDYGTLQFRVDVPDGETCGVIGYRPNGSYSRTIDEQCYWGYQVPRRYYKTITTPYRDQEFAILQGEADKIANSIKTLNAPFKRDAYLARGGYVPDFRGFASGWEFYDDDGGDVRIFFTGVEEGAGLYHRRNNGYSTNKFEYNDGKNKPAWYWLSSSRGHTFMFNGHTQDIRQAQTQWMKKEVDKIVASALSINANPASKSSYLAAGGYVPDFRDFAVADSWYLADNSDGTIGVRVEVSPEGVCQWFRKQLGGGTNKFEYNEGRYKPAWCWWTGSQHLFTYNKGSELRAKQMSIIQKTKDEMTQAYAASGLDGSNVSQDGMNYSPRNYDVISDTGTFVSRSGKMYWMAPGTEGLCQYILNPDTVNRFIYVNEFEFPDRPITCNRNNVYLHIGSS